MGLLPYRKLLRLESKPNEIVVTDLEKFLFTMKGTPMFKIALVKHRGYGLAG